MGLAELVLRGNSSPGGESSWSRVKEVLCSLAAIPGRAWLCKLWGKGCSQWLEVASPPWSGMVKAVSSSS